MMYISMTSVLSLPELCAVVYGYNQWLSRQQIGGWIDGHCAGHCLTFCSTVLFKLYC